MLLFFDNKNILANPGDPSLLALPEKEKESESEKGKENKTEGEAQSTRPRRNVRSTVPAKPDKSIYNQKDLFVTNATLGIFLLLI